jgi:acyl carrier protein
MDTEIERLEKILYKVLEKEKNNEHISEKTRLISNGEMSDTELSSIDYIEFLVEVEKEFDIVYDFDKVFYTVGDLLKYISDYEKNFRY